MTTKMESVVRPFEAPSVFNARVLPPVTFGGETTSEAPSSSDDIVAVWGNAISLQYAAIGITNLYGGVKLTEKSRTTSTVRVSNPDDASQFVDVERIDSLRLKNTATGEEQQWTLNNR